MHVLRPGLAHQGHFLSDEHIRLNGYQANFKEPAQGLLLFIHFKKECGTSVAVKAEKFTDLYEGPFYPESARGSGECPGYCQGQFDLGRCDARCKNAYVRELLGIISRWSKDENDKKKVTGPASRIS